MTGWVGEVHRTVAGRTVAALGPLGLPVRQVGDVVAGGTARSWPSTPCERITLPGTHRFGLLKDRRVAEALIGWLG